MKEVELKNKKNGLVVLLLILVLYGLSAVALTIGIRSENWILIVPAIIWMTKA